MSTKLRHLKSSQLQIRISTAQKAALRRQAKQAGMSMSDWVLSKVFPRLGETFQVLLTSLSTAEKPSYALAELNDWLTRLTARRNRLSA